MRQISYTGKTIVAWFASLQAIGGGLPTGSITEDMLLTMTLLRKGYVTRYLCERLAFGLAPETVDAFFEGTHARAEFLREARAVLR